MKLIELRPMENYRLFVRYDDGASGVVNLSDFAGRGVFAAWKKPGVFGQVRLAEGGHPEWPGGLDLCPDALYMRLTGKRPDEVFPALKLLSAHA
ncbi:MAG: DUF2442 domain-containing protein [Opitutales bacterium]|nr:DUF2442 domain-containing protein [Opitutales bacterium]